MPIEGVGGGLLGQLELKFFIKALFILFLIFYSIFSLIMYRQIQLMGKTLPTPIVPFLKFVAIIHIGVAVAILFIVLGIF